MVARGIEVGEAPAEALPGADHVLERAAEVGGRAQHRRGYGVLVAAGALARPDHAPGARQRVGDRLSGAQPPQRHALLEQAAAEAVDQRARRQAQSRRADQPARDLLDPLVLAPLAHPDRSPPGASALAAENPASYAHVPARQDNRLPRSRRAPEDAAASWDRRLLAGPILAPPADGNRAWWQPGGRDGMMPLRAQVQLPGSRPLPRRRREQRTQPGGP